ncbi:MAG TPA: M48 family metallopeptidase, partial [Opitutaceae bacterium]|nr:M48 family metallopeptidase [Opitutaceae bacterium]
ILGQVGPRSRQLEQDYWTYQRNAVWPDSRARTWWWDPRVFGAVALGTTAVVGFASLFKWSQMRRGGAAVAEMLGGRPVEPQSSDLREKRLLNVVEEMAIASGVPMPAVYVLDREPGLNAFAAGLTPNDAAVAVTRGVLDKLTRDELQGVIAHEFSHILNGDMRLNVRITAIVFGILVIGLIGRGIVQGITRGRVRTGGGKNKGGGVAVILAVGLALLIVGYVGYFFGRLIQAAVSRQREFLADAAAVQFTRNPGGIAGALKKIGGYALGGNLLDRHAAEVGHFLFAQAFKSHFGGLWATHPPLPDRIRAIEPAWNGELFEPPEVVDISRESFQTAGFTGGPRHTPTEAVERAFAAAPAIPRVRPAATMPFKPAAVIADVGALTEAHMRHAQALLASIPERLRDAAHEPSLAPAVVYGLLLQGVDRAARERQIALIGQHGGPDAPAAVAGLRAALSVLDPAARLPLLQLCEPALRRLDRAALDRFLSTLDELVHADAQVTPYEYALQKMLARHLRLAAGAARSAGRLEAEDFATVLACLARAGHRDAGAAAAAFRAGATRLGFGEPPDLPAAEACSLEHLDASLDRLAGAHLADRQRLLIAAAHAIGHDGAITVEEGDLFRAIAATIDCPIPPLGAAS